jgi:hypothetical protein
VGWLDLQIALQKEGTRMALRTRILFILALGIAGTVQAQGMDANPPPEMPPDVLEILLDRDAPKATREAAMQQLVAHAQAGDGYAAFYLGALYRQGMDHPAQWVEQDVETARFWLDKCVASQRCPLVALASLAELELAAGNAKPAMQWAQAWVVLDRELDKRTRGSKPHQNTTDAAYRNTAYHGYLIERAYKAMGKTKDPDAQGREWFDELRAARGAQLDRMLFIQLEGEGGSASWKSSKLQMSAENQREKIMTPDARIPIGPSLGLFLYRGNPEGGRAESLFMIEGLPTPAAARGLDAQARSFRIKPYAMDEDGKRAYALLPISFHDGQYSLVPTR